ncbi:hypothetical protein AGMMS50268_11160 [Spirochaetia bacterium]|nr:hypothetical protein AGMMS50268_11160 [Spirochaetia bacterium]
MEMKWIVLAIAVLMYVLVVLFPGKKSLSALGVAALMLILALSRPDSKN